MGREPWFAFLRRCPSCGVRRFRHGWGGRQDLPFGHGFFHGPHKPFKGLREAAHSQKGAS